MEFDLDIEEYPVGIANEFSLYGLNKEKRDMKIV